MQAVWYARTGGGRGAADNMLAHIYTQRCVNLLFATACSCHLILVLTCLHKASQNCMYLGPHLLFEHAYTTA